jgi:hypothetical protein
MFSMLIDLDSSSVPLLSKRLYSLANHWPNLTIVFKKKWESEREPFKQDFWLSLCSLLSIGANFSSKLSQMLFEVLNRVEPPKKFTKPRGNVFLILLDYLLEIDDRPQISKLTSTICQQTPHHQKMSSSSFHEEEEFLVIDATIQLALLNQIMARTLLDSTIQNDLRQRFLQNCRSSATGNFSSSKSH